MVYVCVAANCRFGIEQPRSPRLYAWPPLSRSLKRAAAFPVDLYQRGYGAPFQKPTRIYTNETALRQLSNRCNFSGHAEFLQGLVKRGAGHPWCWKTSLAAAYPAALCRSYARILQDVAPHR